MCHGFTPLHAPSTTRRVMRCTCGSLHVIWHHLNYALSPSEFRDLHDLLTAPAPHAARTDWALQHTAHATQLWCGPTGVTFTPQEFQSFRDLILTVPPHARQFH
ncbi:hypothetical protein LAJ19_18160 (plasmid) [Deinococcus taeanensis]|uniref:hypothetical protein n=1 Tax=Deinococcus taeanensis TaxID=2737050 RepID=UPI001CDB87E8|nr:hypothetical protein [Deinococcus taeanensis]UBV45050.1 hypothetical protein LAJ19_18160 [Deinococcus taeanensis]